MAPLWLPSLFMTSLLAIGQGLQCYVCTFINSGTSRDMECVTTPWNVTQGQKVMDCPYPYCVIFRQYMRATKKVNSFHRGCEMDPRGNSCKLDTFYSTCSYTCVTDLCNGGDGVPLGDEIGQEYVTGTTSGGVQTKPEVVSNSATNRKPHRPVRPTRRGTGNNHVRSPHEKGRKGKRKCLDPYVCDQSMYWPRNEAVSRDLGWAMSLVLLLARMIWTICM